MLNNERIKSILNSIEEVISFKDPTHKVIAKWKRPNNLIINRVTMPIGVLGVIYEARPNVTSCLLYTSPSPRDLSTSRMPSSA